MTALTMADFKLATAADDIKVWDCNGYSLIKQYNPHAGQVSSIAWSQDNNFIASTSAAGDAVSVTCIKNSAYTITELAAGEDRTCVAFNSNSRYLLCGGKSGTLAIWDLKTQKMKKQYKDHTSPITSLSFNWNDTYIASGAENGDIILYNVVTAHGSQPMTTNDTQTIRQLQYSHYKKALLGAASDDGVVNLWDTNTRRLTHSFKDMHCASVTGLSFSPLNDMLLMSVGLDKRIVCYDVVGKSAVKTMTIDSPLTSVDIHPDGVTLAVGGLRGKVHIYDLRFGDQPIQTLIAHKSSVHAVKFMNQIKVSKDDSSTRSKSTRLNQIRKLHSASTSPNTVMNGDSTPPKGLTDRTNLEYSLTNRSSESKTSTGYESEIISPYKGMSSLTKVSESPSENKPDVSDTSVADMGVFSPLAINNSTTANSSYGDQSGRSLNQSAMAAHSPLLAARTQSRAGQTSPLTFISSSEQRVNAPSSDPGSSSSSDSHSSLDSNLYVTGAHSTANQVPERGVKVVEPRGTSTPVFMDPVPLNNTNQTLPRTILPTRSVQRKLSHESGITDWRTITDRAGSASTTSHDGDAERHPLGRPMSDPALKSVNIADRPSSRPAAMRNGHFEPPPSDAGASGRTVDAISGATSPSSAAAPRMFHTDVVANMIRDCMEEFHDEMRKDMMKLHVEMLRQFQIQQEELFAIVRQHSVNDDLLAEIERLREENKRLKKTF